MRNMRLWELLVVIGVLGVLAVVFLPALARSRESARRSSCQNNLKQMGLVFRMYTNESRGLYPPASGVPGNWMVDMAFVYPEYLTEPAILACPSSPYNRPGVFALRDNFEHPGAQIGSFHPDCVTSLFYVYTGYELLRDEQARALADARGALPDGWYGVADIEVPATEMDDTPPPDTPARQNGPAAAATYLSHVPTVWDRTGTVPGDTNHVPAGSNVLYADGHVAFRRYSYYNAPEDFPATRVAAELFGDSAPQPSRDCQE